MNTTTAEKAQVGKKAKDAEKTRVGNIRTVTRTSPDNRTVTKQSATIAKQKSAKDLKKEMKKKNLTRDSIKKETKKDKAKKNRTAKAAAKKEDKNA